MQQGPTELALFPFFPSHSLPPLLDGASADRVTSTGPHPSLPFPASPCSASSSPAGPAVPCKPLPALMASSGGAPDPSSSDARVSPDVVGRKRSREDCLPPLRRSSTGRCQAEFPVGVTSAMALQEVLTRLSHQGSLEVAAAAAGATSAPQQKRARVAEWLNQSQLSSQHLSMLRQLLLARKQKRQEEHHRLLLLQLQQRLMEEEAAESRRQQEELLLRKKKQLLLALLRELVRRRSSQVQHQQQSLLTIHRLQQQQQQQQQQHTGVIHETCWNEDIARAQQGRLGPECLLPHLQHSLSRLNQQETAQNQCKALGCLSPANVHEQLKEASDAIFAALHAHRAEQGLACGGPASRDWFEERAETELLKLRQIQNQMWDLECLKQEVQGDTNVCSGAVDTACSSSCNLQYVQL